MYVAHNYGYISRIITRLHLGLHVVSIAMHATVAVAIVIDDNAWLNYIFSTCMHMRD